MIQGWKHEQPHLKFSWTTSKSTMRTRLSLWKSRIQTLKPRRAILQKVYSAETKSKCSITVTNLVTTTTRLNVQHSTMKKQKNGAYRGNTKKTWTKSASWTSSTHQLGSSWFPPTSSCLTSTSKPSSSRKSSNQAKKPPNPSRQPRKSAKRPNWTAPAPAAARESSRSAARLNLRFSANLRTPWRWSRRAWRAFRPFGWIL